MQRQALAKRPAPTATTPAVTKALPKVAPPPPPPPAEDAYDGVDDEELSAIADQVERDQSPQEEEEEAQPEPERETEEASQEVPFEDGTEEQEQEIDAAEQEEDEMAQVPPSGRVAQQVVEIDDEDEEQDPVDAPPHALDDSGWPAPADVHSVNITPNDERQSLPFVFTYQPEFMFRRLDKTMINKKFKGCSNLLEPDDIIIFTGLVLDKLPVPRKPVKESLHEYVTIVRKADGSSNVMCCLFADNGSVSITAIPKSILRHFIPELADFKECKRIVANNMEEISMDYEIDYTDGTVRSPDLTVLIGRYPQPLVWEMKTSATGWVKWSGAYQSSLGVDGDASEDEEAPQAPPAAAIKKPAVATKKAPVVAAPAPKPAVAVAKKAVAAPQTPAKKKKPAAITPGSSQESEMEEDEEDGGDLDGFIAPSDEDDEEDDDEEEEDDDEDDDEEDDSPRPAKSLPRRAASNDARKTELYKAPPHPDDDYDSAEDDDFRSEDASEGEADDADEEEEDAQPVSKKSSSREDRPTKQTIDKPHAVPMLNRKDQQDPIACEQQQKQVERNALIGYKGTQRPAVAASPDTAIDVDADETQDAAPPPAKKTVTSAAVPARPPKPAVPAVPATHAMPNGKPAAPEQRKPSPAKKPPPTVAAPAKRKADDAAPPPAQPVRKALKPNDSKPAPNGKVAAPQPKPATPAKKPVPAPVPAPAVVADNDAEDEIDYKSIFSSMIDTTHVGKPRAYTISRNDIAFAKVSATPGANGAIAYEKDAADIQAVWAKIGSTLGLASAGGIKIANPFVGAANRRDVEKIIAGFLLHYGSDLLDTYQTFVSTATSVHGQL